MSAGHKKNNIGIVKESSLHEALKIHAAGKKGRHEVAFGSYVCDGVRENGEIIEVQTGSFGPLKEKASDLALYNTVRIVHPVILLKMIELYDEKGKLIYRRKSPRKGSPWDLFNALLYAPDLALHKNIIIEVVPIEVTETRKDDGLGSWRRKGVSIIDKTISAFHKGLEFRSPADYVSFVPFRKDETFSSSDLAKKAGISPALARKTLYVLAKNGIVKRIEKKGRAWLYKKAQQKKAALGQPFNEGHL